MAAAEVKNYGGGVTRECGGRGNTLESGDGGVGGAAVAEGCGSLRSLQ